MSSSIKKLIFAGGRRELNYFEFDIEIPEGGGTFEFDIHEPVGRIYWGDGASGYNQPSHSYVSGGRYTVRVNPVNSNRIYVMFEEDSKPYIKRIRKWGNLFIRQELFLDCDGFDSTDPIEDVPVYINPVLYRIFSRSTFNQPIGDWDMGNVTNLQGTFSQSTFNQPIGNWDVGNVTTMNSMFSNSQFNQDISGWDVSKVTNMGSMFHNTPYSHDLTAWGDKVGNVTGLSLFMYGAAPVLSPDFSQWEFNVNVEFGNFIQGATNSGSELYDSILEHFAQKFIGTGRTEEKFVRFVGFKYSPAGAVFRQQLINDGWEILSDSPE